MPLIIYHNGECSKSKGALEILIEQNIPHEVRFYLAEPLAKEELQQLLFKLGMKASEIVRHSEDIYKQQYEGKDITEEEWLDILVEQPVLIERPILEKDGKAVIARPPERVFEMIDK